MKRLLLVASVLAIAGCAEVAPSAPKTRRAAPRTIDSNITCRSGYAVAYNSDGSAYCAPSDSTTTTTTTTSTTTSSTTTR